MKFTAKQLNKLSVKHEKEMNQQKKKIKTVRSPSPCTLSVGSKLAGWPARDGCLPVPTDGSLHLLVAGDRQGKFGGRQDLRGEHHPQEE